MTTNHWMRAARALGISLTLVLLATAVGWSLRPASAQLVPAKKATAAEAAPPGEPRNEQRPTPSPSAGDAEFLLPTTPGGRGLGRAAEPAAAAQSPSPSVSPAPEAAAPQTPRTYQVPLAKPVSEHVSVIDRNGSISLIVRDAVLNDVLTRLAETQGFNIVTAESLTARLTITLDRVSLDDALDAILSVAGYTWTRKQNIVFVTSLTEGAKISPEMQGRQVETFELDFLSAEDLNTIITGMLSPVGKAYTLKSDKTDNRKTRESLVVEDLPGYLERVRMQVAQLDQPPRQVLIEAQVLQVDLGADAKHGVDFRYLFEMANQEYTIKTPNFTFAGADLSEGFFIKMKGPDLFALIDCLKNTTDAKTLASPRVLAVNGQTAKIQVGEQLGFRVTTTTETTTTESVQFLDVGVVLEVTPRISREGGVTMRVKPEVSSGQINPNTEMPEKKTTEVETDVMLSDGQGIVIGGLIQETDLDLQSKLPWLGDLWLVGKLFQHKETKKTRKEIIVALLPRVIPFNAAYQPYADVEFERANTPLLQGPLESVARPWEPRLPDAITNPICVRLPAACHHAPWVNGPPCPEGSTPNETAPGTEPGEARDAQEPEAIDAPNPADPAVPRVHTSALIRRIVTDEPGTRARLTRLPPPSSEHAPLYPVFGGSTGTMLR